MTEKDQNADEMHSYEKPTTEEVAEETFDWTTVPTDPDPERLGYECAEWEKIPVADDPDQVIFLPSDEEQIANNAFIVLDDSDLCDLVTRR